MTTCYQGCDQLLDGGLRSPEHCGILDAVDPQHDLLELVGVEMEVLVLDQLPHPAVKVQVALVVVVAEVAGVEEAVSLAKEPGQQFNDLQGL